MEEEKRVRIVFLGSGRVGKTSLIKQFLGGQFEEKYTPTVEDIFPQDFSINDQLVSVDFVDTSGSYNFPAMRKISISRASALVLVYAENDYVSFEEVCQLYEEVRNERIDFESTPLVVVSNKTDLQESFITVGDCKAWKTSANLEDTKFIQASAKTGDGVTEIFKSLWKQNEASKRHVFDSASVKKEPNHYDNNRRRFSAFAALNSQPLLTPNNMLQDAAASKSPKRFFRPSFFTQRRSSTKIKSTLPMTNKAKSSPGPIKLNCTIS